MSMVHDLNKIRVKIGLAKRKTHSSSRIRWLGIWYLTHTQTSTFLLLFIYDFFPQSPVISSQANIHSFGSSFGNRQGFLGNFSASCGHLTQNERDPGRPSDHRASISFAHLYGIAPSFLSFLFIKRYHGCNKRVTFRLFRMCVCEGSAQAPAGSSRFEFWLVGHWEVPCFKEEFSVQKRMVQWKKIYIR